MRRIAVPLLVLIVGSSDAAPPRLAVQPEMLSRDWHAAPDGATVPVQQFWPAFGSPPLAALIDEALRENASIEAARARVLRARAELRIANAALLPTVDANATIARTRANGPSVPTIDYSAASIGLDISYDVDLFGGARAGKRAAAARYAAAGLDRVAAALVVETDVARNFVQLGATGDRIALVDRNLANARELLRIIDVRRREGVATGLDHGLQSVEVSRLAASRAALVQTRAELLAALAVLLGREAPDLQLLVGTMAGLTVPVLDPGQPGDLLFRRPDVRAAEARIAAARGDVDQARAAFRPSLRLSSSNLAEAAALGGPIGVTLSIAGRLAAPIFAGGRLRGQLESASATQVESVALYRQALLTALGEGRSALSSVDTAGERVRILDAASREARRTTALARDQYLEGAADFGTILDAERNQITVDDSCVVARRDQLVAAIDLYKALGGAPQAADVARGRGAAGGSIGAR